MNRSTRSELKRAHAARRAAFREILRVVEAAEIAEAELSARANRPPRKKAKTVEQRREEELTAFMEFLAAEGKAVRTRSIAQRMAMERGMARYDDGYLYHVDPNQQRLPL